MSRVKETIEQNFGKENGLLVVQGRTVDRIVAEYPTPCFVYDASVLEKKLALLRSAFGEAFSIFYSLKANPDPHVVSFLGKRVAGIEIASVGEFQKAIQSGCPNENIIFAGPGKTSQELDHVISQGIGEIHVESKRELMRINHLAKTHGTKANVCLRINPSEQEQGGAMRMGGLPAPFGMDEESIPEIIETCKTLDHIDVAGIHLFAGTQLLDANTLIMQYRRFVELADSVATQLGHPLKSIDFGGGLGVPYFENESALDLDSISSDLKSLASDVRANPRLKEARLIIEPGRFLTAEAGIYISKVVDIKTSRDVQFAIMDGGMHHHLAASGNLGQVIKRNFPIACLNKLDVPPTDSYEVVGPLCTPLDRVGRKVSLPALEEGDLIGIFCSGAYARSASPTGFLSHDAPREIFIDGEVTLSNQIQIGDSHG